MLNRRDMLLASTAAAAGALAGPASGRQQKRTMAKAAVAFLATLDAEQKQKTQMPFNSEERLNWAYVPLVRKGLHYKDMNAEQRKAAQELLLIGLSKSGYNKIE